MTLIIDHELAPTLISMEEAVEALREAYAQLGAGRVVEADRNNLMLPQGWLRTMAAALLDDGFVGYKELHRFHGCSRLTYHLFDGDTGEELAMLDARYLTALRTGACGGLAVDLFAAPDSSVLGVIGSGSEARAQVNAIIAVRPITEVRVFSRTAERREVFCDELTRAHVRATPVESPDLAIAGCQILVVATNTAGQGPAMFGEWLPQGPMVVNSIGSTLPNQRELDPGVWARAERVVVDSDILLEESGDAIAARAAGTLDEARISTLAQILGGGAMPGGGEGITLYKSAGSAVQDVAVAARMYRNLQSRDAEAPELDEFRSVRTVAD